MKILILGGYGTFGGRLAELLCDEARVTLIIAGRSLTAAENFITKLGGGAKAIPQFFDRNGDVEVQLAAIKPDVVVDATGPFQVYGEKPYRLVEAAIAQRVNYLDLADGSEFVAGITQFDARAKAANVFVLSGVSSFPVLTAAVLSEFEKSMSRVDSLRGGIAPSPFAGVGLNVIRAIASYTGKPLQVMRDGRWQSAYGLTESMRYTIAPPGMLPLRNIHFSLVDVPDLKALPQLWPQLSSVWMGAGPVPVILHRMLNALAWVVRFRVLPSALPFARIMDKVINTLRWGEDRGGMFVEAEGLDKEGHAAKICWHLLAEGKDGPMIPSMACEAIIRATLDNKSPVSGARSGAGSLSLADYERLFSRRSISTGIRRQSKGEEARPIFWQILGSAWDQLPSSLQALHSARGKITFAGKAEIDRGRSLGARIVCALFGFPQEGKDVTVRVAFNASPEREIWERTFGSRTFRSHLKIGSGRSQHLLSERFGPIEAGIALVVDGGKLNWVVRRWSMFGVPMPSRLAPCGLSFEHEDCGCFCFHVEIKLPLIGLVVRYRGWLRPEQ